MRQNFQARLPYLGIRSKLLIAFVGLALGPLVLVAAYGIHAATTSLTAANSKHLRAQVLTNAGYLEAYLRHLASDAWILEGWVRGVGIGEADSSTPGVNDEIAVAFARFARMRPELYQVRLLDLQGRERIRVERQDATHLRIVPAADLQDKSSRYYFREAMALPAGETYFSSIDLNREHGVLEKPQRLVLRVARQVLSTGGEVRGLIVINVFASEILDRLKLLREPAQGDVLLVGPEGSFVREECRDSETEISAGEGQEGPAKGSPAGPVTQQCVYRFGEVEEYLVGFSAGIVQSMLRGELGVTVAGDEQFISYAPIHHGSSTRPRRLSLAIVYSRDVVLGPVERMMRLFVLFGVLVAAVALVLAVLGARALTVPIRNILRFVGAVADGDFGQPLEVHSHDEIEELAGSVRATASVLESAQRRLVRWNEELQQEVDRTVEEVETLLGAKHAMELQLRHSDRLASLGMLSASLAHEIGNPLASIKTVIQVHLKSAAVSDATREAMQQVLSEINRLAQILERTTNFGRQAPQEAVAMTLREVYYRVELLVEREAEEAGIELRLAGDGVDQPLMTQGQQLDQVLLNLLVNALQAMDEPGTITVSAILRDGSLEVTVSDTGPGIPEHLRARVFEPFLTTKGGGTGLGLPIVRQITTEMGGEVWIECPADGGTRVELRFPIRDNGMAAIQVGQ